MIFIQTALDIDRHLQTILIIELFSNKVGVVYAIVEKYFMLVVIINCKSIIGSAVTFAQDTVVYSWCNTSDCLQIVKQKLFSFKKLFSGVITFCSL